MYALNLTNFHHKSQIQHILNKLNKLKTDSTTDSNSNANVSLTANINTSSNSNSNVNVNTNANANQEINSDIEMKNTQIEQNGQKTT